MWEFQSIATHERNCLSLRAESVDISAKAVGIPVIFYSAEAR